MNDATNSAAADAADTSGGSAATLVTAGTRPSVRFERVLADAPAAVWRALTDPQELTSWFPCEIAAERWEAGAALTFVFPGHEEYNMRGVVLECDEPRVLAYTWGEETLRFELTPTPSGGTRLVLFDELDPGIAARNAAGWQDCLERLAGRVPTESGWKVRFAQYSAAFEPVLGPQEGPPPGFEDQV